MTVEQLIAELRKHPQHKQVRALLSHCYGSTEAEGIKRIDLEEQDALPVDRVVDRSAFLMVESV